MSNADAHRLLEHEAKALLHRLREIRPFALTLPMVAAATPSVAAQAGIEAYLAARKRELQRSITGFLTWLGAPASAGATPEARQRRFASLRLQFLAVTTQFDIFADALAERSQHGHGELLGGLDAAALDALALPNAPYETPPIICHLDRGAGAAIRRARTRLPGGGANPVAIIQVPRERMVGSGIGSSLVHEVGHQGAALLNLVPGLRDLCLERSGHCSGIAREAWMCFARWISEIVADLWSVARTGITSTLGLISVVSFPKPIVLRVEPRDPHPAPWIRVKVSSALGRAFYPDPQWERINALWESLYPLDPTTPVHALFRALERELPEFVARVLAFRPESAGGASLGALFPRADRTPARLRELMHGFRRGGVPLAELPPTVAFAAIGQAKFDGSASATDELTWLTKLLRTWALRATIDAKEACAPIRPIRSHSQRQLA